MQQTPQTISEMMRAFGRRRDLADAVGAELATVHKWAQNNRIPPEWQGAVVGAAQSRGLYYITAEWMLAVHAREVRAA